MQYSRFLSPETEKRIYHSYISALGRIFRHIPHDGIEVMDQDWNNLLVLDACRYDTFESVNWLPGTLKKVQSQATSTPQWLQRNFTEQYDDVVYVAGNPYVSKLAHDGNFNADNHFHHVEHVWEYGWEDTVGVPPKAINEATEKMREQYPDKRLILHYMQPHEPFLGDTNFHELRGDGWESIQKIWHDPAVKEAYRENLELVLDTVEDVLPNLTGDTVITADHGEILQKKYGLIRHPKDVFIKELYEIPQFDVDMTEF